MRSLDKALRQIAELNLKIKAIEGAIKDEGPNPRYHHDTMRRHRSEWPMLWDAIDELLKE